MRTAAVAFLLSMILAAVLTPRVRDLALARGWLDHAVGSRKIHGRPVPRVGGLAIVLGFFAPILTLFLVRTGQSQLLWTDAPRTAALLVGGLCIAALGVWDDLRGAGALVKFGVQALVAAGLWGMGFRVETIAMPFGGALSVGLLSLPLTVFWIVGVTNAMNLIDGLDGLAGGVALFALGTSFVVAFARGETTMALFSAALAGSVLGFLFYNWNPASIFMGDTGSMFLGYVLAAGSILTHQKSSTAVALLVPIVALGLPITDTLLAIGRRAWRGRPLFSADREHIHHKLLGLGLSQRQAVLVLWGTAAFLGASALVLSFASSAQVAGTLCVLAVLAFWGVRRLGYLSLRGAEASVAREHNRALRGAVREAAARLREAGSEEAVWAVVAPLRAELGASLVQLDLPGEEPRAAAGGPAADGSAASFAARFPLGEVAGAALRVAWSDGRAAIDRDDEIALEVLCDHLAAAIERVRRR